MITMGRVNHRFFLQRQNLHNAIIAETYSGSATLVFFHSFFYIYIDLIPLHSYSESTELIFVDVAYKTNF